MRYSDTSGQSLSGLRKISQYGHLVKIPGAGLGGGGRQLAGGGGEPLEGTEELGTDGKDYGMGGIAPTVL